MIRLRHTDEWVGLMVIAAAAIFFGAVLEAGVLRDWFRPAAQLRILLPDSGVGGLVAGADVQVLGTHAGTVRRVVLNPGQPIYAEADIDRQAEPFIRRDSVAVIRRTFGVAGAAYLDISRGTGQKMDWQYAVIRASVETGPTDTLNALLKEVTEKVFPVIDDAKRTMDALASMTAGLNEGRGTIGRLLIDDTLAVHLEQQVTDLGQVIAELNTAAGKINDAAGKIDALAANAGSSGGGVPELISRANGVLANLQSASRELALAAPQLPAITRNLSGATANLPALLTQTQATAADLQRLVTQLRGLWLLGGGGRPLPEPRRLPASQIQP